MYDNNTTLKKNDYLVDTLGSTLRLGFAGLNNVPPLVKNLLLTQAWKKRLVSQTNEIVEFTTFAAFLKAYPPEGLDTTFDDIWRICNDYPDVQDLLDNTILYSSKQGSRSDLLYNVQEVKAPTGNSRQAAFRKLRKYAKERPDVAEAYNQVLAGEISAHCALIKCGLRKPRIGSNCVRD